MKKVLLLLLVIVFVFVGCGPVEDDPRATEIAQCLTDNGAKMYGAVWCSHCTSQKKSFGSAWEIIDYIECDARTNKESALICVEENILGLPTWEFANGERLEGKRSLEELAEKVGCEQGINN